MGRYVLNVIYLGLVLLLSPWLMWRRLVRGKTLGSLREKLWGCVPTRSGARPCLWLHAVSVGEVLQIEPVVSAWRERHPDWDVVISTTTTTGRSVAEKTYPECRVCYCPWDFSWAVRRAFRRIRPTALALVELELWPNLIREAARENVPLLLINGRLSDKSFRGYRRIRGLVGTMLRCFRLIAVQNEQYAKRFCQLGAGPDQLLRAGSIKFDRLRTSRTDRATQQLAQHFGLPPRTPVLMGGSTHEPEEEILVACWKKLQEDRPDLQLILAPRHAERFLEVARMLQQQGLRVIRRSECQPEAPLPPLGPGATAVPTVYLLDTLGELSACWGLAHLTFVGGSLTRRGGQNMMEPAGFGCAILLGPNTWNFSEVVTDLKAQRACREVQDAVELEQRLRDLLNNPRQAREMGQAAQEYVLSRQGGTALTIQAMEQVLCPEHEPHSHTHDSQLQARVA